jgi:signal peptidase I
MTFKKQIQEYLHYLRKKWNYSNDLFTPKQREEFISLEAELKSLIIERGHSEGEKKRLEHASRRVEKLFPNHLNVNGWAENIEVFFVAIVLALAIRTYFYQPFKIPTDSMKPTLWGIATQQHPEALPNPFKRIMDLVIYGKSYHEIVAKNSGNLGKITEGKLFGFIPLTVTQIPLGDEFITVFCGRSELFKIAPQLFQQGREIKEGEVLARFERLTGDQIFVNRWSYHFRLPEQGEVFVFTTHNIPGILEGHGYSSEQYYIKRCVGVPGVTLQIAPPYLLSNGVILGQDNESFKRIYSRENGYSGYTFLPGARYLIGPDDTLKLPDDQFWAMGDNSPNSSDSRRWGYVPRENLIGTGSFVYWPFGPRWGWIK